MLHSGCLSVLTGRQSIILAQLRRQSMMAWKITDSLNNPMEADLQSKLRWTESRVPTIAAPNEVLVKVHSSSINPLDVRMCYGYGRRVLDLLDWATNFNVRISNDRYPLILGRDFSGEVVATGPCAAKNFKPGDLVFGAVEPQRSGAHGQYVSVPSYCVASKPENLSHNQAASVPFAALTAYSALSTIGRLHINQCTGKQVLVIGGSGGVGSLAVQLLKVWGANVTATCSEDKMEWLENELLVDKAICYNDPAQMDSLRGRFDFVLDCGNYEGTFRSHEEVVENSLEYLKPRSQSVYVTLSPPILKNTDENGIVLGGAKTAIQAATDIALGLRNLNSARWAVFLPNKWALNYFAKLYADGTLNTQVSSVFSADRLVDAFLELQSGRAKGKIVVDMTKLSSDANRNTHSERATKSSDFHETT